MSYPTRISILCVAVVITLLASIEVAQAEAVSLSDGAIFRDCADCPEIVVIPAGSFTMGSTPEETEAGRVRPDTAAREWPAHRVTLPKAFGMGRFEITRAQYGAFIRATGHPEGDNCTTWNLATGKWEPVAEASWRQPGFPQDEDHPAGCLDLADVRAYVAWLSTTTGQSYRLPTEAEWEYVARAGTSTMQSWGDSYEDLCAHANASDLDRADAHGGLEAEPTRFFECRDGFVYTAPVGSYPPNQFGLYDVIGNIWEWVEDCYYATYEGAPADGSAWIGEDCDRLVVRGGGWYSRIWFLRPAGRSREPPEYRSMTLGLRVVRQLP